MELSITRDGLRLHALLECPGHDRPCPIVVMCHGFGGSMDAYPGSLYQRIAKRLVARGMAVLRFDFNGHGRRSKTSSPCFGTCAPAPT